jgi:hypothetical protein
VYPALIQFCSAVMSDCGAPPEGGGIAFPDFSCMRAADSCASVRLELSDDFFVKSA